MDSQKTTGTNSVFSEVVVSWQKQTFSLLPGGACYWFETQSLLVSDLHLGREVSFRRAGLPLPEGPSTACLSRLEQLLLNHAPRRIYILGDLVHAHCSLNEDLEFQIRELLSRFPELPFHLIEGNHDRRASRRLKQLGLQVTDQFEENGVVLIHDGSQTRNRCISGHLHPGVRVPGEPRRLPCFWIRPQQILLPAFGNLTGTFEIRRRPGDQVYLMTPEMVARYPAGN